MKRRVVDLFCALASNPRKLTAAVLGTWIVCSLAYAALENKGPIEGLWWGIVTGSTVGYGDFYPESTAGRFVGAVLIVSMLILTACAVSQLVGLTDRNAWTHEEQEELLRLQRENHDMLVELLAQQEGATDVRTQEEA